VAGDAGEDGLFAIDPVQRVDARDVAPKPPVDKTFRAFDPGQGLLLPPSLDDWLPAEHLARLIAELVDEHLDLSRTTRFAIACFVDADGGIPSPAAGANPCGLKFAPLPVTPFPPAVDGIPSLSR
jgi:hypothetical protein